MKPFIVSMMMFLFLSGCQESIVEQQSLQNQPTSSTLSKDDEEPPQEELLTEFYHLLPQNSHSVGFNPGEGDFMLEFNLLRDIITGGSSSVTSVHIVVRDKFDNVVADTWYNQVYSNHWYTYNMYLTPGAIGQYSVTITVPSGYYHALTGSITLHRNTAI